MKTNTMRTFLAFCCVAALAGDCALGAEAFVVTSPLVGQVVQRDKQDQAAVTIAGTTKGGAEVIEAKADLSAGATGGKSVGWTVIARKDAIAKGRFTGKIPLRAGGWYTISVRARRGKLVIAEHEVKKVGVGDVFITAGQSNSANFGRPRQSAKDDRVVYFNGKGFVSARDPIPGGFGGGGTPWPILGDLIVRSTGMPVCFRSTTLSYSPVREWLPGAKRRKQPYYETLVKRSQWFGRNGIRAVLWHQGESDSLARTSAKQYCKELGAVIKSMRRDLGFQVDWFVAGASFHPGSKKREEDNVLAGQELMWKERIAFKGPLTDDLLGKKYRHDGVHFNGLGLKTHAERWCKALAAQYKWRPARP